jgi:hypothetical protein
VIPNAALSIASAGVGKRAGVDAQAVFAGSIRWAVLVAGTFGFDATVDGVTLIAARAEADGVVVGGLADGVGAALGRLARVSTAASYASFTGDAVLKFTKKINICKIALRRRNKVL